MPTAFVVRERVPSFRFEFLGGRGRFSAPARPARPNRRDRSRASDTSCAEARPRLAGALPPSASPEPEGRGSWGNHGFPTALSAGELRAAGDRPVRFQRLEAEVAARGDDRRCEINEPRTGFDGQGFLLDVELEAVERAIERHVSVLGIALHCRRGRTQVAKVALELEALNLLLRTGEALAVARRRHGLNLDGLNCVRGPLALLRGTATAAGSAARE